MAGDGEEALNIVRREKVHLVMLDMHMPKLTGLETLRRMKEYRAMLPCIILSANLDETLAEQARLAHANFVLSKSMAIRQITSAVLQTLRANLLLEGRRLAGRTMSGIIDRNDGAIGRCKCVVYPIESDTIRSRGTPGYSARFLYSLNFLK